MKDRDLLLEHLQIIDLDGGECGSTLSHLVDLCIDIIRKIVSEGLEDLKHFLQLRYILRIVFHSDLPDNVLVFLMKWTGAIRYLNNSRQNN